jgi:signal transduction histidine kinase
VLTGKIQRVLRPPQSLLVALVATTLVATAAVCWSGWRLLEQQTAIDRQRAREQLESGADAIASGIREKLANAGERLSGWLSESASGPPIKDAATVVLDAGRVQVVPSGALPFVPTISEPPARLHVFFEAESSEFVTGRLDRAAAQYRVLASSRDVHIRAGALLRLGRVLRRSGDFRTAVTVYRDLAALGSIRTDSLPAEFASLYGQRAALAALGDDAAQRQVANQLLHGLDGGRWLITEGAAEFYREEISTSSRPSSWQLAAALSAVWRETRPEPGPRGQRVIRTNAESVLVMWRSNGQRTVLLASFPEALLKPAASNALRWHLADSEGLRLAGDAAPPQSAARIIGGGLPWTLRVWPSQSQPTTVATNSRTIVLAMMGGVLLFLWSASYFIARAIRREANVARLQSNFIAAVSHEFRSPLTTVRQMTEMLQAGRVPSEARRQTYYGVIAGEAARLQRLIETLLNFGRMEAGAERYEFADIDAAALVRDVVRDMEPQAREAGQRIEITGPFAGVCLRADANALAVAVRNLIDNAIKYSPTDSTVEVRWSRHNGHAAISVVDRGVGIPQSERRTIFERFVRGRAAIDVNVKGTGLGLSMVKEIVRAHGGDILLESEVHRGSVFTLLLPSYHRGGSP